MISVFKKESKGCAITIKSNEARSHIYQFRNIIFGVTLGHTMQKEMILFCENREQNSLGAICVLPASIVMCEAIIKLFALACKQKVKLKNKNILRIGSLCSCVNQSLSFPIVPPYPIENFKIWRKKTERNKINSITFSKTTDSTKDHHTHAF